VRLISKKRTAALARVAKLQTQLHKLKQARAATLERERVGSSDELGAIFEALTSGQLAYGAQAKLGARHALAVEKRIAALVTERDDSVNQARGHGMRAKLAERVAEAAGRKHRDLQERKELADLVERAIARRETGPT
jgi:hypothetical protein